MLRAFFRGLLLSFKSKKAEITLPLLLGLIIIVILIGIIALLMAKNFGVAVNITNGINNTTNSMIAKTP